MEGQICPTAMLYTVKEPTKKRAKRMAMQREPKVHENEKSAMFINGHK